MVHGMLIGILPIKRTQSSIAMLCYKNHNREENSAKKTS